MKKLHIGIAGYGRMGRLIHREALGRGHLVPVIVDPQSDAVEITDREFTVKSAPVDVIIDFSTPGAAVNNIRRYGQLKVPAVIGTTGWYDQLEQVASIVAESGIGLVWSGNFSLGVNLFLRLVKAAGVAFNRFPQYDAAVHESHHRHKVDSPSGTAEMIAGILTSSLDRKQSVVAGVPEAGIAPDELGVFSTRCGSFPGSHQVIFDSEEDSIILEHSARSRSGFAGGALLAAEWVCGRKGLFKIDDFMHSIIGGDF